MSFSVASELAGTPHCLHVVFCFACRRKGSDTTAGRREPAMMSGQQERPVARLDSFQLGRALASLAVMLGHAALSSVLQPLDSWMLTFTERPMLKRLARRPAPRSA